MRLRNSLKNDFFQGEGDSRSACDPRAAVQVCNRVFGKLGTWAHQTHVAHKNIQQLRKLIQFPSAQKRPHQCETLIAGCCDGMMALVFAVDHGAKLEDREFTSVTSHALLK